MSIIHDALKKVQNGLRKNPSSTGENIVVPGSDISQGSSAAKPNSNSILILCSSLFFLGVFGFLFFQLGPQYFPSLKPIMHRASKFFAKPTGPLAKISTPQTFKTIKIDPEQNNAINIQGVMRNGNSTVALINGKISLKGDVINGVKIIDISSDSVTLLKDGKEEKIHVRR